MSELVDSVQEFKKIRYCDIAYPIKFIRPCINYFESEDKKTLIVKNFYENGILQHEDIYTVFEIEDDGLFKAGLCYLINGISNTYDKNGMIDKEYNYVKGKLHGVSKKYDSGVLTDEYVYENDKLSSESKYIPIDGETSILLTKKIYKDGKLDCEIQYPTRFDRDVSGKLKKKIYVKGKIVKTIEIDSE